MSNIMDRSFTLKNITPPAFMDGYEVLPAGYITFSSYWDYKKIKNINRLITRFLKRLTEINNDDKVLKCLELIESLVDDCNVMRLDTEDEETFNVAFPGIVRFIKKVGFGFGEKNNKLYNAGINILFDDYTSGKVKDKYIIILHKLFKKNIWPFVIFM